MKKAIIFDLDGTLLDSIADIAESMNEVLTNHQFPAHTIENYRFMIGRGIENLVIDALPPEVVKNGHQLYLQEMKEIYGKRWMMKTSPYNGISELLSRLNEMSISISILSNKPHAYTIQVKDYLLKNWTFDRIYGSREHIPIKPAPDGALQIASELGFEPADFLYVGDTNIDMQTANAAEMTAVGVAWGFRPVEELKQAKAHFILKKPLDLLNLL